MNFINKYITSLAVLYCCLITAQNSNAQGWQWARNATGTIGVDSWSTATDATGNIYAGGLADAGGIPGGDTLDFGSGVSLSSVGNSIWVKYSNSGTPLWAGCTDGYLSNIAVDPSGNLILFGIFFSDTMHIGTFTLTNAYGTAFVSQYFLAKVSPSGTVLWAINDGSTYYDMGYPPLDNGGVTTDTAGNIYITSCFYKPTMTIGATTLTNTDPSGYSYDIFVAKYSPTGIPLWASSIGGIYSDFSYGIIVAPSGDVYITGNFDSPSIPVGTGTLSNPYSIGLTRVPLAYIAKFSSTGVPLWGQSGGGINGASGAAFAKDNDGNIYMIGNFNDTSISLGPKTQ